MMLRIFNNMSIYIALYGLDNPIGIFPHHYNWTDHLKMRLNLEVFSDIHTGSFWQLWQSNG